MPLRSVGISVVPAVLHDFSSRTSIAISPSRSEVSQNRDTLLRTSSVSYDQPPGRVSGRRQGTQLAVGTAWAIRTTAFDAVSSPSTGQVGWRGVAVVSLAHPV